MNESVYVWLWAGAGVLAGAVHAALLRRASQRWKGPPLVTLCRIPVVVAMLVGAAIAGSLLPAVGGWAAGLGSASVLLVLRSGR